MKVVNAVEQLAKDITYGLLALIFGPIGVGKTCSLMQSLPGNLFAFSIEKRPIMRNLAPSGRDPKTFSYMEYEGYYDLRDGLASILKNEDGMLDKYDSFLFDSLSDMLIFTGGECRDASFMSKFKADVDGGKFIDKRLSKETKQSMEDWGAMAIAVLAIVDMLGELARKGKIVVCTARIDTPTDSQQLIGKKIAPLFKGNMFGDEYEGKFDMIGLVAEAHTPDINKAEPSHTVLYHTEPDVTKGETVGKPMYKSKVPAVSFDLAHAVTKKTGDAPDVKKGWNNLLLDFGVICGNGKAEVVEVT